MEPSTSAFRELVEVFVTYGPWAIAVIEAYVIRHLYLEARRERAEARAREDERNEKIVAGVREQVALLSQNNENHRLIVEALAKQE